MEAVRSVLFGAMMLEKILSLYKESDKDTVWDVRDYWRMLRTLV